MKAKSGATQGLWNNPGGHRDQGESDDACALRETREETGFVVCLERLLGTYNYSNGAIGSVTKRVYLARIVSGEL